MTGRRARGEGTLFWHERRQRWIASMTVSYDGRGKRVTRSAAARPTTSPTRSTRERDTHDRVRPDRISNAGNITLRVAGRLRHTGIGRTYAGTANYQPTGRPPGPPPRK